MLDFVEPLWSGRNLGCVGRQAELERLKLALKIGIRAGLYQRPKGRKHGPARSIWLRVDGAVSLGHGRWVRDPSKGCGGGEPGL